MDSGVRSPGRSFRTVLAVAAPWLIGGAILVAVCVEQAQVYGVAQAEPADTVDSQFAWLGLMSAPFAAVQGWLLRRDAGWRVVGFAVGFFAALIQVSLAAFFVVFRLSGDEEPLSRAALQAAWGFFLVGMVVHGIVVGCVVAQRRS